MKELFNIQQEMKSGKDCYNNFGNFAYRNLEQMLTILKPLLRKYNCTITFNDDLVELGGRVFVKATATLSNGEESISSSAYAETDKHKGMSLEQCTGTASSYARKYACCGLLSIDDNKDADELDNTDTKEEKSRYTQLVEFCKRKKSENPNLSDMLTKFFKYYNSPSKNDANVKVCDSMSFFNVEKLFDKWLEREMKEM